MANTVAPPTDTAAVWNALQAQRTLAQGGPEGQFLTSTLPIGLAIFGGLLAYGFSKPSSQAKWAGGIGLVTLAVEYFAVRRAAALAPVPASTSTALAVVPDVQYIPPPSGGS